MEDQLNAPLKSVLRQKAVELLQKKTIATIESYSDDELSKLIDELESHNVAVDLVNCVKGELNCTAENSKNLFDCSLCGYITITNEAEILEVNCTVASILGKPNMDLLHNNLVNFISEKSIPIFSTFLENLFQIKSRQSCEIMLSEQSETSKYISLTGDIGKDSNHCYLTMVDISGLIATEHALQKSKLLINTSIENQKDTIIFSIDASYCYLSFNNVHLHEMKAFYNTEVKIGKNILDLITSLQDKKAAKENYDRALRGESHSNITIYGVDKKAYFESYYCPIIAHDQQIIGVTVLANNITNIIQDSSNLKVSQENLQSILDSVSDAIYVIDKNGSYIDVNKSAEKMYRRSREELIGKSWKNFAAPGLNDFDELDHLAQTIFENGESKSFEFWAIRKNGEIFPKEVLVNKGKYLGEEVIISSAREITDRKKIENSLKQSQEKLQGIFNLANSGIGLINKDGRFLTFNDWCCNSLGYTRNEFQELTLKDISHPDDLEESSALNKKLIEGRIDNYQIEKRYIRKDKSILWCEVSASAIKDNDNNVVNIIGIINEITERIHNQKALQKSEARLLEAQALAKVGSWETNLSYSEANWSRETEAIFGINPKNTPNPIEAILAIIHPEDRHKVETVFVNSIKKNTLNLFEHRIITPAGIEKIIEQRWKIESDSQGKPKLAIGTCQDITARKQAEYELENEKRRLKDILLNTGTGTWEWNIHTGVSIINEQWASIIGYTLDELKDFTINGLREFTHPDDFKSTDKIIEKHFNGELDYYEAVFRMKHKNGHWVWILDRGKIYKWDLDGKPLLMSGTHQDITERKLAEEKIQENKKILRAVLDNAPVGIWMTEEDGRMIFINQSFCNSVGISEEQFLKAQHYSELYEPENSAACKASDQEAFAKDDPHVSYEKILFTDGKIHDLEIIKRKIIDQNNDSPKLIGIAQDITERKHIEDKLKLSSEKFEELVNSTGGIVWEADAQTLNFTFVSKQAERLLGYDQDEWYTDGFWENHLHPEDKDEAITYCATETKNMLPHDFIYRFISKNGNVVWLRDIVNIVVEEGKPRWMRGVMFDVTHLKETNLLLTESEEKYRGLVENAPYGIIIYVQEKIAFVNAEVLNIFHVTDKGEVIGKSVLEFVHPDSIEDISKRMKEVLRDSNASATVEAKFVTLDNIPFEAEIKAIPTMYDRQLAVQVIIQDISRQKQSALDLNKINRVYALISQINNLIIRTDNRDELFQEICNIAVDFGKFHMSWIGLLNEDNIFITAAFSGYEKGYFTERNVTTILDVPEGRGPTGIATREARTVICNDIANDEMMQPWRKDALDRGYNSLISIPIIVLNKTIGAFNLYSDKKNFFSSEEEILLLEKITLNIAFALESILAVEERKQTDQKIRQLSRAVEQSPVTIIITDIDGEIEYANPKFVETSGYSLDEVKGKNPRFLKSGYTSDNEYKKLHQTITSGKEWQGEFHNEKKDGTRYWESAKISPILNSQSKITHFIYIKEDITERKIAEQELINAKLRAEESDRLKLVFLANMSHEIRTPMNGILGFTELLKLPHLTGEEQQEYINIIEKSGKRMLNIINDIISISKVESGQIEISLSKTDINEQIDYIHNFFKLEANQKGIRLHITKVLPPQYRFIKTDKEKIYAILTNLIKNAIKFTNEGTIEFGCEMKGEILECFVKDSGIGISNSQKSIIFERFRQANESLSRSHEGSGLGLAISKAYIEMLGGNIWVESELGKGTTFYFTIPFISEEKTVAEKVDVIIEPENKIKDLKVLIVEDDAISKLLITIAIKPFCKEVLKVSNGIEAVTTCRENLDIDLVMMDINMPKMSGYEATKLIREFNEDLIIIAQTANGMQSDREAAIEAGCTDYISKPINIKDLGTLIQKYFKK